MSRTLISLSLLGGLLVSATGSAQQRKGPEVTPRPTAEQIAQRQKARPTDQEPRQVRAHELKRVNMEKNEKQKTAPSSLLKRSAVLSGTNSWSLVPRGAVLNVPPRLLSKVDAKRNGKLEPWSKFYVKNRAWIRLVSVTVKQATGEEPLSKQYIESLKRTGVVVVAVCDGSPISVHLPREGVEPPTVSKPVKAADWIHSRRR